MEEIELEQKRGGGLAPWAEGSLGLCRWQPRVHRELTLVSTANILFILIVSLLLIIFLILITPLSSSKPSFFFFFLSFYIQSAATQIFFKVRDLAKKIGRVGLTQNPKFSERKIYRQKAANKRQYETFPPRRIFSRQETVSLFQSNRDPPELIYPYIIYPPPLFDL